MHKLSDKQIIGKLKDVRADWNKSFNFSAACNFMGKNVNTGWILLLNDDCFVQPNCLGEMLKATNVKNAAIVGAKLIYPSGAIQDRGLFINFWSAYPSRISWGTKKLWSLIPWIHNDTRDSTESYSEPSLGVSGACLLVKTEILKRIRFDERFPMSYEDADFCWRAKKNGVRVIVANKAVATHLLNQSSRPLKWRVNKMKSLLYFFRKYPEFVKGSHWNLIFHVMIYPETLSLRQKLSKYAPKLFQLLGNARNTLFKEKQLNDKIAPSCIEP
jgi:GT2 family glycosyltransferase